MDGVSGDELHALLDLARQGDSEARGKLLEMYREYLRLLARVRFDPRLRGKLSASDLVQETFVQASRGFSQFKGATEPELIAWLRRILVTQVADQVRHYSAGKRNIDLEEQLEADLDRSSQTLEQSFARAVRSPSQAAIRREQAVLLADALAALPPLYREVLVQRHLQQRSFPQIAQQTGLDLTNVKGLWRRAVKQLREEVS